MPNTTMTERDMFIAGFTREYATTLRLLEAYPPGQSELRPSPRSKTARELAFLLALGQGVAAAVATKDALLAPPEFTPPATWDAVLGALRAAHAESRAALEAMTDEAFQAPFTLLAGPGGKTATMRRADALWFFLMDHVHHRGQFSVYARMAGGRVPSIYGPSGDEPWA